MRNQVGLRKHYYEQTWWRWRNSSWPFSNPKRWSCEIPALNRPANLENSALVKGLEKVSFHFNPKKGNAKECSNYHTISLTSHTSKVMLKILQARLQKCMNRDLPDAQAGFRKSRGTRDEIANIHWITEKAREFQKKKNLFLLYWPCQSLTTNWKILKEMGITDHLTCLFCMQIKNS